jgi:hypothetical protein
LGRSLTRPPRTRRSSARSSRGCSKWSKWWRWSKRRRGFKRNRSQIELCQAPQICFRKPAWSDNTCMLCGVGGQWYVVTSEIPLRVDVCDSCVSAWHPIITGKRLRLHLTNTHRTGHTHTSTPRNLTISRMAGSARPFNHSIERGAIKRHGGAVGSLRSARKPARVVGSLDSSSQPDDRITALAHCPGDSGRARRDCQLGGACLVVSWAGTASLTGAAPLRRDAVGGIPPLSPQQRWRWLLPRQRGASPQPTPGHRGTPISVKRTGYRLGVTARCQRKDASSAMRAY